MFKVLPALVGGSMLGLVGVASATEPVTLTDGQMDELTAGTSAQLEMTSVPSTIARAWVTGANQDNNQVTWYSGERLIPVVPVNARPGAAGRLRVAL